MNRPGQIRNVPWIRGTVSRASTSHTGTKKTIPWIRGTVSRASTSHSGLKKVISWVRGSRTPTVTEDTRVLFDWGSGSNYLQCRYDPETLAYEFTRSSSSGTATVSVPGVFPTSGHDATVVAAWDSGNLYLSVNGSSFVSVGSVNIPTIPDSTFDIGSDGAGNFLNATVDWASFGSGALVPGQDETVYTALPDSLTLWSTANPEPVGDATMMSYPANSSMTGVWPAVSSQYRVPSDAYIWTGYVEQWPSKWEGPSWSEVDCTAIDGFEALAQADIQSLPGTLTTAQGSNKDITYTSNAIGSGNNSITISYVNTGSLSISVTGIAITVNINAGTTTASAIITAVNADPTAGVLVTASLAPGSTGAGAPAVMGATNLAGGTFPQELAGARISRVLDAVNWPSTDRVIDAGQSQVVAQVFSVSDHQKAKTHINDVENSELGYVYLDARGFTVYHDRAHRTTSSLSTVSQATFGDASTELEYSDLVPNYDKTYIYNYVAITPYSANIAQTAQDTTSQGQYMLRTYSLSTLLTSSADALSLAQYILGIYKQPSIRFASMTLEPVTDVGIWLQVFSRTIGDRITVVRRPPTYGSTAGPPISIDSFIESISWKFDPGQTYVTVTYELSPIGYSTSGLKLDDSTLGKLDSGNALSI